jgi:predicted membrane protein
MQDTNRNAPCCCGSPSGSGLVAGVIIIAVGVILLLDRLGIVYAHDILRYWPGILVAIGLYNLLEGRCAGHRVIGGVLTVVGGLLLLDRLDYVHVRFWDLWPVIVIVVGLLLLWRAIESRTGPSLPPASSVSRLNEWAVFGGVERRISAQDFEGGEAFAMFGGIELDLREAAMKGNQAVIQANAIFGGVEIRVPENWLVTIQGVGIFGGYGDNTRHPRRGAADVKELLVRGGAVFGGVDVKN